MTGGVTGLVEAVRLEHRRILDVAGRLVDKAEKWPLGEHATRKALHGLVALESRHEAAEARFLWPVVRDLLPEYAAIRETAEIQERQARWQLHHLHKAAGTEAAVDLAARVVRDMRIHVGLEESQILPALEAELSRNDALSLGPQFQRASELGPTRPHPRTPAIPGVLALVGPVARRADRLRDLLRLR